MKYFLYIILSFVMSGCSAGNKTVFKDSNSTSKLEHYCLIEVESNMGCALIINNSKVYFDFKIENVYGSSWAIKSIHFKDKVSGKEGVINGSDYVRMQLGDLMEVKILDINFDGIEDLAISTSFGVANFYYDYWLVDKEGNFQFIGDYPEFRIHHDLKTLETQVRSSAAEYIQETYHWEGSNLVSDKKISIGPDNISELW